MTALLLTGAGGFLGSHVLETALNRGWDVVAVDSFTDNGITDRIENAIGASDDGAYDRVTVVCHDLRAPFSERTLDRLGRVDYVVHAAARCSVDDSIADPRDHVLNNVASTLTVLDAARELRPATLLHVSTDEVFGRGAADAGDVGRHRPSSPYAASKAACEDVVAAYATTYAVPAAVVNSANLFGPRQSQLAFVPRLVRQLVAGDEVTIHATGDRPGWRWYTYAPNVAAWIVDRLPQLEPTRYVLRGQLGIDNLKLAETVADLLGVELRHRLVDGDGVRPGWDPRYERLPDDDDAAWRPEVTADDGLARTVEWFLAHPDWLRP